jgi:hypothetical protein
LKAGLRISVQAFLLPHTSILHVIAGFRNNFSGLPAALGKTLSYIVAIGKKAGTSFLKRLLEGFSQIVSDFIEASRNFILDTKSTDM